MKKLTVNLDAVAIITLVLVASLGMNVWQFRNIKELMVNARGVDRSCERGGEPPLRKA